MQPLEQARFQNVGERSVQPVEIAADDTLYKPGFRLQAQAAVACAKGQTSEIVRLEESLKTMRLIHEIFGV